MSSSPNYDVCYHLEQDIWFHTAPVHPGGFNLVMAYVTPTERSQRYFTYNEEVSLGMVEGIDVSREHHKLTNLSSEILNLWWEVL